MDSVLKYSKIEVLRICHKCDKAFVSNDVIPLCSECRYKESNYKL